MLNQGDPLREKRLLWNSRLGFVSDNSEDEAVKYARSERFLIKERKAKHGD